LHSRLRGLPTSAVNDSVSPNNWEVRVNDTSDDSLTPSEVKSLRRVHGGLANFISQDHHARLMAMGLIYRSPSGRLKITEVGRLHLEAETGKRNDGRHCK